MNEKHTENNRLMANVFRLGVIAEVNLSDCTARVQAGEILTDFLPWLTFRAGTAQTWSPPTKGEQVLVLAIGGDFATGLILPAIYASNSPNHSADEHSFHFPDGAVFKYNHATGAFSLTGVKTGTVQANKSVTLDCPQTTITGNVQINGNIKVNGAITAKGDVKGGSISLQNHQHQEQGDGKLTSKAK